MLYEGVIGDSIAVGTKLVEDFVVSDPDLVGEIIEVFCTDVMNDFIINSWGSASVELIVRYEEIFRFFWAVVQFNNNKKNEIIQFREKLFVQSLPDDKI